MIVIMEYRLLRSEEAGGACSCVSTGGHCWPNAVDGDWPSAIRRRLSRCSGKRKMHPEGMEAKVYFGCQLCGAVYGAVQIKAANGVLSAHACEICSTEVVCDSPDFQIRNWTRV